MFFSLKVILLSLSISLITTFCPNLSAQDTSQQKFNIHLGYGYQIPLRSDLSVRYGPHGMLGMGINFILKKWETGPAIQFLFGSSVKEDVLAPLRSANGELIGSDHQLAEVDLRMRGILISWSFLKQINLGRQSIFIVGLQPGWLSHWIRFQNPGNTFEPIQGNYRYGYDRLSSGLALSENIAYRYQSKSKLINFELALNLTESISYLKRNIQLDQPYIDTKTSVMLLGIQAKWLIPIFRSKKAENIFY